MSYSSVKLTAQDIITSAIGEELSLLGDQDREILVVKTLDNCTPGAIVFARPTVSREYLEGDSLSGAVIVCSYSGSNVPPDRTYIVSENPRLVFLRIVREFFSRINPAIGIHPTAIVDPSARIDSTASVGPYSIIGANCVISANVIIHGMVTLYADVKVGARTVISSGTVVGADGFGYERNKDGVLEKFPHIGGVIIGEDVEIGSNTSIDRGTIEDTVIGNRVRIDNQCHISHNVRVGCDCAIIAQSMIGGSVTIGDGSWIAPAVIVKNQVKIGCNAFVGMSAVVVRDVPDESTVAGSPAVDLKEFKRMRDVLKRLGTTEA